MLIENIKSLSIILLASALFVACNRIHTMQTELMQAEKKALQKSIELNNQIAEIKEAYQNEKEFNKKTIDDLRAKYANGLQFKNRTVSTNTTIENRENECRLDAGTINRLIRIAGKGDECIIRLNACIDSYNALRN